MSVACVTREIQVQPGMNLPVPADPFWHNGHRRSVSMVSEGRGRVTALKFNLKTSNNFSFIFSKMYLYCIYMIDDSNCSDIYSFLKSINFDSHRKREWNWSPYHCWYYSMMLRKSMTSNVDDTAGNIFKKTKFTSARVVEELSLPRTQTGLRGITLGILFF